MSGRRASAFDGAPFVGASDGLEGPRRAWQFQDVGCGKTIYGRLGQTGQPVDLVPKLPRQIEELGHDEEAGDEVPDRLQD